MGERERESESEQSLATGSPLMLWYGVRAPRVASDDNVYIVRGVEGAPASPAGDDGWALIDPFT